MLNSEAQKVGIITMPNFNYRTSMVLFNLETLVGVPKELESLVKDMTRNLKKRKGIAFLTADCKQIQKGKTHRRPGAHIDGNYLGLDLGNGGGGGWKVGDNGSTLTREQHQQSYCSSTGGMLIVSDYQACKGWTGVFDAVAGTGGSCEHLELGDGFWLQPLMVYQTTSQFIHESMPIKEDVTRHLVRITLPSDH